jgi:ElaB/YqjD/DUF883 family membrane-anchored ribosome-binding protein
MDATQQGNPARGNGGVQPASSPSGNQDAREKLMADMKTVINDAESWLRTSGQQTGDDIRTAKAKFEATLQTAKADLIKLEQQMQARTKDAAKATNEYVKDNPWKAVGLGAAVGVICGMLISRP